MTPKISYICPGLKNPRHMIQRIQSVFLLLAAGGLGSLFAVPFARSQQPIEASSFMQDSLYNLSDHVALMVVFGLTAVLALVSIFLFRNRKLQLRLVALTLVGVVAGIALAVGLLLQQGITIDAGIQGGIGAYLPLAAIVFLALAYRFIQKDDKLVRSMDRLR